MTWDYADGYVLLFGGSNVFGVYSGDTWTYKSGVWTELSPLTAPEGRDSSGLAWSGWDNAVALFGGYTPGTGGLLNDTWLFTGGAWTQLHTNAPPPRWGFAFVYDPNATYDPVSHSISSADVLFGGNSFKCSGITPTGAAPVCNETWYFWFDSWTNQTRPHSPYPKVAPSMIFDSADGHLVLFGGSDGVGCVAGVYCGDTWQYNWTKGWVQVPTPSLCGTAALGLCPAGKAPTARDEAAFAFDFTDGYAILFGGRNSTSDQLSDTWKYLAGVWTKLAPTTFPDGRSGEALTYDFSSGDGYLLIVAGTHGEYVPADLEWSFTGGAWAIVTPPASQGPGALEGGSMVYDTADGYVLYYGGYDPVHGTWSTQTWKFDGGVWTQLFPTTSPYTHEFASMQYDPTGGFVLLFGGSYYGSLENTTWGFQAGNWFYICGDPCAFGVHPPAPREGAGMAYDQATGYMILFGGYGGRTFFSYQHDTWAFVVSSSKYGYWTNYTGFLGPTAPGPRALPGMAWDQYDREIVLFGGGNGSATYQDTWVMTDLFSGWSEVGVCGGPGQSSCAAGIPNRAAGMIFTYDGADSGVIMSGGSGYAAFFGYILATTALFQAGHWYICSTYECQSYYTGLGTYDAWGAGTYDVADGYTVTAGGESYFYNFGANGAGSMYYWKSTSWALAQDIHAQGPGFSPTYIDLGQSVTFSVGATGGGFGTYSFEWEGLPQGCAPASPQSTSFSCLVQYLGYQQYGSSMVYGSYYDPMVTVFDSSGYPSYNSYPTSYWLNNLNVAPDPVVFLNGSASTADVGQKVYFEVTGFQGWGPLTFKWYNLPYGCAIVNTTGITQLMRCILTNQDVGTWLTYAQNIDATGYTVTSAPLSLVVFPAVTATGIVANTAALDVGQTLSLGISPSGGTGTNSYAWSGVPAACKASAPVLTCVVPSTEVGTYSPSVTVRDSNGGTFTESYPGVIVVSAAPTATALTVTNATAAPTDSIDAGEPVTFTLTSTIGSGGDTISWSGLPTGCTPLGPDVSIVSCAPSGIGSFSVQATISDSNGGSATSPSASLAISSALSTAVVSASSTRLDVGMSLTLVVQISGGSGGESYRWSGLPTGCTAGSVASLTCSVTGFGTFTPAITIRDSNGQSTGGSLAGSIVVSAMPTASALTVTNSTAASVDAIDAGQAVAFTLVSTVGAGGDTIVWSGLPTGCTPSGPDVSSVSCSPSAVGLFSVHATITDSNGGSATSPTTSLTISSALSAPVVTASSTLLDVGMSLTLAVQFSGGSGGETYRWTGLPTGCAAGSVASLTCIVSTAGSFTPVITIRDANGQAAGGTLTGSIVVSPMPTAGALTVANDSMDPTLIADAGQKVTFSLAATLGSGGATIAWTGLPGGCSPSGTAAVEVSCSPSGLGTYAVHAVVTDSNGGSATSPVATLIVSPALAASTLTASSGALDVGAPLTLAVSVSGGSGGTTFAWSGLPMGCVASNTASVSCTVTGAGRFTPTVTLRDAAGATVTTSFATGLVVSRTPTATGLTATDHSGSGVATVASGASVTFTLAVTPGSGGDTITWSGLPAGCTPSGANATTVTCSPTAPGSYAVSARITDSNGVTATSPSTPFEVTVQAAAAPFATNAQWVEIGLLGALLALGALAVVLALRRPGGRGGAPARAPPEPAAPWDEDAAPAGK
ncbi:MAG: hypothetical protein L3J93_00170 [Thermoplasmata archaeon]|nr:hypothetical protein [Thermoplasmata archaeon]